MGGTLGITHELFAFRRNVGIRGYAIFKRQICSNDSPFAELFEQQVRRCQDFLTETPIFLCGLLTHFSSKLYCRFCSKISFAILNYNLLEICDTEVRIVSYRTMVETIGFCQVKLACTTLFTAPVCNTMGIPITDDIRMKRNSSSTQILWLIHHFTKHITSRHLYKAS